MSLLTVFIIFKDGSERTICNVLTFRYYFESYRYRFNAPFFEVKEGIFDELDIVGENKHVFPLDTIDSIEVF